MATLLDTFKNVFILIPSRKNTKINGKLTDRFNKNYSCTVEFMDCPEHGNGGQCKTLYFSAPIIVMNILVGYGYQY